MLFKIFSIYDQKAKAYLPPFIMPEQGQAERVFGDCVNSQDHQFAKHPEDYTLMEIGTFDDNKGKITAHSTPMLLGIGVQYRNDNPTVETVAKALEAVK